MGSVLKKKYPDYIWNILYSGMIFILVITQVHKVAGPVIMPDEVGYWATGAKIAGFDWSGIMRMSPYYGYGYGVFLGFIMHFIQDPIKMFRAAVVLNALFMIVIYYITYKILTIIKAEWAGRYKGLLSFAVTVYAFNIYYSMNSEAEILQVMVYLAICYLVLQCSCDKKIFEIKMVFISFLAIYLVACHQRNLGIVVALSFCVLLMLLTKKITFISFLTFMVSLGIGLISFLKIKGIINETIFLVSNYTVEEASKVSGALGIFTLKGLKSFIECVSGRFFYLGCASFLLVYRGIVVIFHDIRLSLNKKKVLKKNRFLIFEIFAGMSLFAEIAIGALAFLGNEKRIDGFLYGRYNEHVIIPILLYGFFSYRTLKNNTRIQIICSVLLLALSVFMKCVYIEYGTLETSTHSLSAIIGMPICRNINEKNIQVIYSSGIAQFGLLLSWFLFILISSSLIKKQIVGILVTAFCWIIFGLNALNLYFFDFTDYNTDLYLFAGQVLEAVDEDAHIYYLLNKEKEMLEPTSSTWLMYRIQYYLPEKKVNTIDVKELTQQDYILVYKYSDENKILSTLDDYKVLAEGKRMILYYYGRADEDEKR